MMNKIEDTLGLCEHCYRHVPAKRFVRDHEIWLSKVCPEHGYSEHLVDPDADFYLSFNYARRPLMHYLLEVTNKCNLACPHCYQMPSNRSTDPSIENLIGIISTWPDDGYSMSLCGAEPTVRKDLPELIEAIRSMPRKFRRMSILTNGVNLSNYDYARTFQHIDQLWWTIGLNHPDYQGSAVRKKQIQGMKNCEDLGMFIKNISYTLYDMSQLEYCLLEMQEFGKEKCQQYRVRCGSDIGRTPGGPKVFLSDLVKEVKRFCKKYNWSFEEEHSQANRAHYSAYINGLWVKIIQWPDVKTLDLLEIQTESWSDVIPGKPRSPLVHQVILRDGAINKGLPLLDTIPQEYIDNYGHTRN